MLPAAGAPRAASLTLLVAVAAIVIQHSSGSRLSEGRWKRQSICRRNQFQCNSGKCVEVFLLCDGQVHCDDGSDETAAICQRKICPSQAFKCKYGACIDRIGVCNGIQECADGSDEASCATRPSEPRPGISPARPSEPWPWSSSDTRPPEPRPEISFGTRPSEPRPGSSSETRPSEPRPENSGTRPSEPRPGSFSPARPSEPRPGISSTLRPTMESGSGVRCPALTTPSRDIFCKVNDRKVDCSEPVQPGTVATVECRGFYFNKEEPAFDTICQFNGQWSRAVTPCQPKCGEPTPEGLPFVAGGTKAKNGEFPWHAGIYRLKGGNYEQICGGNVISERVIISAGHCFWDMASSSRVDIKGYKVAVGKYYREWNNNPDMVYVQTPEIEKVVMPQRFRGNLRNWHNDLAIITLKDVIRMSIAIRPICVDFNRNYERLFVPGTNGIVVGWGLTENFQPGEVLHKTSLPYVSFEDCEKEVPKPFLVFLSNDKICAGYINGTSVCPGDGGGGYATKFSDGKWYLMGIVSVGVPARNSEACNVEQYATFTKVSDYYSFIQDNLPE